jgi:cytoskeletal protein CcmA (bactofilin family)
MAATNQETPGAGSPPGAAAPARAALTYIGDGMEVKGSISTGSSVIVAGFVEGDVNSAARVDVFPDAVVQGSVTGQTVNVAGTIEGDVNASGRLHISSTGKVQGDVEVKSLHVEEGGAFLGRCKML